MSKRSDMLASSVRRIITPLLPQCPPVCGVVAVTDVEISADCSHATVYLSALQNVEDALEYFQDRQAEVQRSLGALKINRIPRVRFRLDPRTIRGERIDTLLEKNK